MTGWELLAVPLVGSVTGVVSTFFIERSKNLAMRVDLKNLEEQVRRTTAVAEEVRSQMAEQAYLAQKHWDFKREVYTGLLQSLDTARRALESIWNAEFEEAAPSDEKERERQKSRINRQWETEEQAEKDILKYCCLGRIWLKPEAVMIIDEFETEYRQAESTHQYDLYINSLSGAVNAAFKKLMRFVKTDLAS